MSSSKKFSSPSPVDGFYDVFLSFRGIDTRKGFTTNLYHSLLDDGIHTFMDIDLTGEEIEHLFQKIKESRIALVIYSERYASSDWCLRELEMIMQRKKDKKMLLIPIFYKVNLDELKHLKGQTAEYLDEHIAKHGESNVEKWKVTVTKFGNVSGHHYKDTNERSEHDFIKQLVIPTIKKRLEQITEVVSKKGPVISPKDGATDPASSQVTASTSSGGSEGLVEDKQCFTYGEILKITNNLDKLIARGALGDVYRGNLNGAAVAVKIFSISLVQKVMRTSSDEFKVAAEEHLLLRHENLVSLVGYCREDENVAYIYEFMENGDLRKQLSGGSPRVSTWKQRLRIAADVAEGLKYLHGVFSTPVTAHGNLQTTDILFDETMTVKILFFPAERESYSTSTFDSYITGLTVDGALLLSNFPLLKYEFRKKLDLHTFAMILYELVTGYVPNVISWKVFQINLFQGNLIVDMRLAGQLNNVSAVKVQQIVLSCAQMENIEVPQIGYVLEILKQQALEIEMQGWTIR